MQYPWIKQSNDIFKYVLIGQFFLSFAVAFFTGTWLQAAVFGVIIIAVPLFLIASAPYQPITRYSVAIAVQLFTALHIQQSFGLTEMHFQIFVVMAFLAYYKDVKVIFISVLTVAVHHITFFMFQLNDTGLFVLEEGHLTVPMLLLHAGFAIAEGIVLMIMCHKGFREATAAHTITHSVAKIMAKKGEINLAISLDKNNENLKDFNELITQFRSLLADSLQLGNKVAQNTQSSNDSVCTLKDVAQNCRYEVVQINQSVTEMEATITDVARRAVDANQHSSTAMENTEGAKQTIHRAFETIEALKDALKTAETSIDEVNQKCDHIASSMDSIKAVAEQTNLLALNAAIESARAGEHGRGFSVVADEVRKLATKSQESAGEIDKVTSDLVQRTTETVEQIKSCVEKVGHAVEDAKRAEEEMHVVASSIQRVDENIEGVATAAEQQTAMAGAITQSVNSLSDLSADEIEQVETVSEKSDELGGLMHKLDQQLGKFVA